MRALVIGGTAFIGPYVVRDLLHKGIEVLLFNRGKRLAGGIKEVRTILGDRNCIGDFRSELLNFKPDIVIDMIPLYERHAAILCDMFKGVCNRIVAISSMDVYRAYGRMTGLEPGHAEQIPFDENAPLREKMFPYRGVSPVYEDYEKILVERAIQNGGIPYTILRLPMVYGPGDYQHRTHHYLKRMLDARSAILIQESEADWRCTRCYVENAASAIVSAALSENAADCVFNVGDEIIMNTKSWIQAIALAAGWKGAIIVVPQGKWPSELESGVNFAQEFIADSTLLRRRLQFKEPCHLADGMFKTIEWERANPPASFQKAAFNYEAEDRLLSDLTK